MSIFDLIDIKYRIEENYTFVSNEKFIKDFKQISTLAFEDIFEHYDSDSFVDNMILYVSYYYKKDVKNAYQYLCKGIHLSRSVYQIYFDFLIQFDKFQELVDFIHKQDLSLDDYTVTEKFKAYFAIASEYILVPSSDSTDHTFEIKSKSMEELFTVAYKHKITSFNSNKFVSKSNKPFELKHDQTGCHSYIHKNAKAFYKNTLITTPLIPRNRGVWISLSTIPSRFTRDDFIPYLRNLSKNNVQIVLNICKVYQRSFNITPEQILEAKKNIIEELGNSVLINETEDYGPITKILGLRNLLDKQTIHSDDIVIIVDDDHLYRDNMVYLYQMIFTIYNADIVCGNTHFYIEKIRKVKSSSLSHLPLASDNYQDNIHGYLSFGITASLIPKVYDFYKKVRNDKNLVYHDDCIMTLFYKYHKLNTCVLNYLFIDSSYDSADALHIQPNAIMNRKLVEKKYLSKLPIYKRPIMTNNNVNEYSNVDVLVSEASIHYHSNTSLFLTSASKTGSNLVVKINNTSFNIPMLENNSINTYFINFFGEELKPREENILRKESSTEEVEAPVLTIAEYSMNEEEEEEEEETPVVVHVQPEVAQPELPVLTFQNLFIDKPVVPVVEKPKKTRKPRATK
jgi:hypothetical protein